LITEIDVVSYDDDMNTLNGRRDDVSRIIEHRMSTLTRFRCHIQQRGIMEAVADALGLDYMVRDQRQ
jgi:hypothetical protein